jgi:hypothetical protein
MKKLLLLLLFMPMLAWSQFNPNQPYATVNNACGWAGFLQNGTYYSNAGAAMAGGLPTCSQPLTGFPNGIALGTGLGYADTGVLGTGVGTANGYLQFILQNLSSGAAASSDFIVNNNQSTATTYYGDFGMNSSGFAGSGAFNAANEVYLTSTSSDLAIGTTTSNAIHFVVNGSVTDAITVANTGAVTIPTLNVTTCTGCGGGGLTANLMSVTTSPVTPASATPVSSGLSSTVVSAGTYAFEVYYFIGSASVVGSTFAMNGGSATITSVIADANTNTTAGTGLTGAALTSYTSTFSTTSAAVLSIRVVGSFVVNVGGTFNPTYATGATATDTLLSGSWMRLIRIN